MKDYLERKERLLAEASECELTAQLATDKRKRVYFEDLARQFRTLIQNLDQEISKLS